MSDCFVMRSGGGAGLNFRVVGGMAQPANPAENTIWVQTDVPVTGWAFCTEEPTEPAEGMMWFVSNSESHVQFNALKKNEIELNPSGVKQYVSGAWVTLNAQAFLNGAWVPFTAYIYNLGVVYIPMGGKNMNDSASYSFDASSIKLRSVVGGASAVATLEKQTIKYSTLKADVTCTLSTGSIDSGNRAHLYVGNNQYVNGAQNVPNLTAAMAYISHGKNGIVSLDLSNVQGASYYVGLDVNTQTQLIIRSIWFE